jgi:hypothetical protein
MSNADAMLCVFTNEIGYLKKVTALNGKVSLFNY